MLAYLTWFSSRLVESLVEALVYLLSAAHRFADRFRALRLTCPTTIHMFKRQLPSVQMFDQAWVMQE